MAITVKWQGQLTEHFSLEDYTAGLPKGPAHITEDAYSHAMLMEEFRRWLKRPIYVTCWFRTPAYNKKVGGVSNSSHLLGIATDWHTNKAITEAMFIKYAKKWKEICERHGCVGEAGLYTWGIHFGSHIRYSKSFYNWDSRSGVQKNMWFRI